MLYTEYLNDNKDFLSLYHKGKSVVSKAVVLYFRKNGLHFNRLGITTSKKIGNAVKRNRAKRIIIQAYRENELSMPIGIDMVIVARTAATNVKSNEVSSFIAGRGLREINNFFKKSR